MDGMSLYTAVCFVVIGLLVSAVGWGTHRDGDVTHARFYYIAGLITAVASIPVYMILEFTLPY